MEKSFKTFIAKPFLVILKWYKLAISPFLAGGCRFQPTCSEYAAEAIKSNGVIRGSIQTMWRLMRCNPYDKSNQHS